MTDIHSKEVRSFNMSRIKGRDTKPERIVRQYLFRNGYRYRLNVKSLAGKPDIVLARYKTVIFVNGCFWHGHKNCKYFVIPKTRTEWWLAKIHKNTENDRKSTTVLEESGWQVLTVWECQLRSNVFETLERVSNLIGKNND